MDPVVDAESGLIYLRARYYDPATGQFLSRDPLVALTGEAYGYVNDNPLNGIDPLGLWSWNPAQDVGQAWHDTLGQHWRGATQVVVSVVAAGGGALCVATTGVCVLAVPFIGCGAAALNNWIGGANSNDIKDGCAEGAMVSAVVLLCPVGFCEGAIAAGTLNLGIGGVQGALDYSRSSGCHNDWGYVKATVAGLANNAPIPWDKIFGGGDG